MSFRDRLLESWDKPNLLTLLLWPLSLVYRCLFALRSVIYRVGFISSYRAPVPVIVVGNLTVGGTGKTPMVMYLVRLLQGWGYKPAVISRGYGREPSAPPLLVTEQTAVADSGDEPALIARRSGVPVCVSANRRAAIEALLTQHDIDVIVSDDGLQHLAMQRDIEVCLVDMTSSQSNRHLLPAGPYREPASRLDRADLVVAHTSVPQQHNGFTMQLEAQVPVPLVRMAAARFDDSTKMHAVAGIGNPQRFFNTCRQLGFDIIPHAFPDHHAYLVDDLEFDDELPVLMTEKDAIKCMKFADQKHWYLPVDAKLSPDFDDALRTRYLAIINE